MVYRLLRTLLRHSLSLFFRSLEVEGRENVPPTGPLLLAANHPNTLIDVLLVATCLDRKVGFVAKATLFKNPLANLIFRFLGAVPIHRRQDGPVGEGEGANNSQVLGDCEDAVAQGGAILIFPEGISQAGPRLMKLKTGLARIGLGAEAKAPGQVVVVPAALVYDDPDTFRSRARITYAPPIHVAPFRALGEQAGDPFVGVRALTEAVRQALLPEVVHVDDTEHDALVDELDTLYGRAVSAHTSGRLAARAAISNAINAFNKEEPARVERVRLQLAAYRAGLDAAGVDDAAIRDETRTPSFGSTLAFLISTPLALWGVLNHLVLYNIPRLLLKLLPSDQVYASTVKLGTGLLGLVLTYTLQGWGVFELAAHEGISPAWTPTLIYLGTLPICGLIALLWAEGYQSRRRAAAARARRRRLPGSVRERLSGQRAEIIAELDAAQAEYMAKQDSHATATDEPW